MAGSAQRKKMGESAKEIMEMALRGVQNGAWRPEFSDRRFDVLRSGDVQGLRLMKCEPPAGGLYDHQVQRRHLYLSQPLLSAFERWWNNNDEPMSGRRTMAELFLAHELYHIGQHVDSDTYRFSVGSDTLFDHLDYEADAFAAKVTAQLERDTAAPWNHQLAVVLNLLVGGSRVFDSLEGGRADVMDGSRLRRQLVWTVQCARAACFVPERTMREFELSAHCYAELFKPGDAGKKINLTATGRSASADEISNACQLHVLLRGRRYVVGITDPRHGTDLARTVFEPTVDRCFAVMRTLFSEHPELTGRAAR